MPRFVQLVILILFFKKKWKAWGIWIYALVEVTIQRYIQSYFYLNVKKYANRRLYPYHVIVYCQKIGKKRFSVDGRDNLRVQQVARNSIWAVNDHMVGIKTFWSAFLSALIFVIL